MKQKIQEFMPLARKDGVIVQHLSDEVLVYDLERHKAHCLNQTAALIWERCDGKTTVSEIARLVGNDAEAQLNEQVVWLGIERLSKAHLLPKPESIAMRKPKMGRREMVKTLGIASVLSLPLVTSILAPTAYAAASCAEIGQACETPPDNLPCCGTASCTGGVCI